MVVTLGEQYNIGDKRHRCSVYLHSTPKQGQNCTLNKNETPLYQIGFDVGFKYLNKNMNVSDS